MLTITQSDIPGIISTICLQFNKVPLIKGAPGVGKTHIIRQWADDNGYTLLVELLSTSDPMMFRGLQGIDTTGDEAVTVDCKPAIIAKTERLKALTGKPVIIFLDEFTLAPPSMQGAALTFLQDREINGVPLPEDTIIVTAGNSGEDSSAVYDLTGPAQNRVVQYHLVPEYDAWSQFMLDNKGHPLLLGALKSHDEFFYEAKAGEATGPFPSPRQWHLVSDFMNYLDDTGQSYRGGVAVATVHGLVGAEAASAILSTIDLADGLPTIDEIMDSPNRATLPDVSDRKRQYLAMSICQSALARADIKDRKATAEATFEYIKRMPEAFVIAFIVGVCNVKATSWAMAERAKDVAKYAKHLGAINQDT